MKFCIALVLMMVLSACNTSTPDVQKSVSERVLWDAQGNAFYARRYASFFEQGVSLSRATDFNGKQCEVINEQ